MCGISAGWNIDRAVETAITSIHGIQHRGQESCGITSFTKDGKLRTKKNMTTMMNIDIPLQSFEPGRSAFLAQNRYSTATEDEPELESAQPLRAYNSLTGEEIALVHNGQLNGQYGWQQRNTDSERILQAYCNSEGESIEERIRDMLTEVSLQGSYSLCMIINDPKRGRALLAAKDPQGNRPLCMGRTTNGGYLFASESSAFDNVSAHEDLEQVHYERELEPGEAFLITQDGANQLEGVPKTTLHQPCFFEWIYFAFHTSRVFGERVDEVRKRIGHVLAQEEGEGSLDVDGVIPVQRSGDIYARAYAEHLGLPVIDAMERNPYSQLARSFIGKASIRRDILTRKLHFVKELIEGKKVAVVDDSAVRGTTSHKIVRTLYNLGAEEVHLRFACPPITHSCYFGIDTPQTKELIAHGRSEDEIRIEMAGGGRAPTSVRYLSYDGLISALPVERNSFCDSCITGDYMMPLGNFKPKKFRSLPVIPRT